MGLPFKCCHLQVQNCYCQKNSYQCNDAKINFSTKFWHSNVIRNNYIFFYPPSLAMATYELQHSLCSQLHKETRKLTGDNPRVVRVEFSILSETNAHSKCVACCKEPLLMFKTHIGLLSMYFSTSQAMMG